MCLIVSGVKNVDIDMELQKVTVTGWVDQEKVLEKVRKTGKKAELWPFPYNPEVFGFTQYDHGNMLYTPHSHPTTYFHGEQQVDDITMHSYNGRGYMNGNEYQYQYQESPYNYSSTTGIGERASVAFSDENVNACSIM